MNAHTARSILLLLLCALICHIPYSIVAQEEDKTPAAPAATAVTGNSPDSVSMKDTRRLEHKERLASAPSFFDHSHRAGRKGAIYSAALPGLGQIYNRKFWKLPLVYGAVGSGIYFSVVNGRELRRYNKALETRLGGGIDEFNGVLTDAQLTERRNLYRKNTETSALVTVLAYLLSIVDATVDAHLFTYDISDDLSMAWHPNFLTGNNGWVPGIQLSLGLK